MDLAPLQAHLDELVVLLRQAGSELPFPIQWSEAPHPHPTLAGEEARSVVEADPSAAGTGVVLRLSGPAFFALDPAERVAALDTEVRDRLEAHAAGIESEEPDEGVFEQHARFRAGQDLPRAWYRSGVPLAPGVWVVDLDVFMEVRLPQARWSELLGQRVALRVLEEELELELPEDFEGSEALTLEGAGLYDDDPGVDEDDPAPETGDLHLMPWVY